MRGAGGIDYKWRRVTTASDLLFFLADMHEGIRLSHTNQKAGRVFHVREKGIKIHKTMCVYTEERKCTIT